MTIRPLDLLDLPSLYRYRDEAVSLDAGRMLTRGNPLGAVGMLAYMNPRRHVYTAVSDEDGLTLLGGVTHLREETFAKMLYLAPTSRLDHPAMSALIEQLAVEAGNWGAFHVLAEVDESSPALPVLRTAGFSVYAWQRMWDVSAAASRAAANPWKRVASVNLPSIQSLYHEIVPPLLQPVESMPRRAAGFICTEGMRCYVSSSAGMVGILLTPLIHPEATEVGPKIAALINHLPNRGGRPVYICVRSFQAWLEPVLEDLGARVTGRQAVMVKHLAHTVKDEQAVRAAQPVGVTVQPSRTSRIQKSKS
jgi:hypothetical protein